MRIIYGSHLNMVGQNKKLAPECIAERWGEEQEKIYKWDKNLITQLLLFYTGV